MKRILLLPVKNEAWILPTTLAAASMWADHIIVADQDSTDGSLEIYSRFPRVQVVRNPAEHHTSSVRKLLLDTARQIEGNNVLLSFDADEIPTAAILGSKFWREVGELGPGTVMEFQWVQLWRRIGQYRTDGLLSPHWKAFGFIDDRKAQYDSVGVLNDHTSRVPIALMKRQKFEDLKILHYQYVQWDRMLIKQAHYRMIEWTQNKRNMWQALKINLKYFVTKDERGLTVAPVPEQWVADYVSRGVTVDNISPLPGAWQAAAIEKYFALHGPSFFSLLDIWDAVEKLTKDNTPCDPRRSWHRIFHAMIPWVSRLRGILKR